MVAGVAAHGSATVPTPPRWEARRSHSSRDESSTRGRRRKRVQEKKEKKATGQHHNPKPQLVIQQRDLRDGDFQRLEVLGEGSYSVVLAARHLPSGLTVALKELSRRRLRSLNLETQLQWEINLHRTLRHPNIVRLLSYYITSTSVVLVLELCPNGTLQQKLQSMPERRFNEARASCYIGQVALGLAYLHEHGIVHRDLKPENILLDAQGVARLGDFGWSKALTTTAAVTVVESDGIEASGGGRQPGINTDDDDGEDCEEWDDGRRRPTVCGTLDYLSPELLGGTPYSYSADMWSLGALLVELLCGKPPFYRTSQRETLSAIRDEIPQLGDDGAISPLARDLALQLLQKDPNKRPTVTEVLQHPWLRRSRDRD
uniref:Aurora kinase n=1 Tax=Trypanosoma congolense (strain IL3000) TaxID=1068625 RepID=G0UKB6_TRYCI|nr:putative serine/threonine-protein kinase [Trypanosoma congolense IL3000]